jgi:hypothetical protein
MKNKRQFNVRVTRGTIKEFGQEARRLGRIDKLWRRDPLAEAAIKSFLALPETERERIVKEVA